MVHIGAESLIVGYGEIGRSLGKVIGAHDWIDTKERGVKDHYKTIHICIPFSRLFENTIRDIKHIYPKALIIVHSTVPVGTCDKLSIIHSPVRGVHPHLEEGIRTFIKYFGGKDAKKAAKIFKQLGIRTKVYKDARTTEALKLFDTFQYGKLIMLEKQIYKLCEKHNVDFKEVYQQANKDYNEGYVKLGRPEVVRPYLKHIEGPIGGHCVIPNAKLLGVKL